MVTDAPNRTDAWLILSFPYCFVLHCPGKINAPLVLRYFSTLGQRLIAAHLPVCDWT